MPINIVTNEDNMAMMTRYPNNFFDLAIIDPPYGIGYDGEVISMVTGKSEKWRKPKGGNHIKKGWDIEPPGFIFFKELQRVSKNQILWGANHYIENIPNSNSSCWIFWDKKKGNFSLAAGELAWTSFKTAVRIFEWQWHGFIKKGQDYSNIHPTQKPTALYTWLLQNYAKAGDKILDTHLGSGSSRIAAYDLGFDFYGCELDKDYFNAQEKRFQKHIAQIKLFAPVQLSIIEQTTLF